MGRVKDQLHRKYRVDKHAITFYGAECPDKLSDSYCPNHGEKISAEFRRRRTDSDAERIRAKKKRQRRRKRRMADDPSASSGRGSQWHGSSDGWANRHGSSDGWANVFMSRRKGERVVSASDRGREGRVVSSGGTASDTGNGGPAMNVVPLLSGSDQIRSDRDRGREGRTVSSGDTSLDTGNGGPVMKVVPLLSGSDQRGSDRDRGREGRIVSSGGTALDTGNGCSAVNVVPLLSGSKQGRSGGEAEEEEEEEEEEKDTISLGGAEVHLSPRPAADEGGTGQASGDVIAVNEAPAGPITPQDGGTGTVDEEEDEEEEKDKENENVEEEEEEVDEEEEGEEEEEERKPTPVGAEGHASLFPIAEVEVVEGQASVDVITAEYLEESDGSAVSSEDASGGSSSAEAPSEHARLEHSNLHTMLTNQIALMQQVRGRLPDTCGREEGLGKTRVFDDAHRRLSFMEFPSEVPSISTTKCPFCRQHGIWGVQGSRAELRHDDQASKQFEGDTSTMCHINVYEPVRDGDRIYAASCCSKCMCEQCLLNVDGTTAPEGWAHWNTLHNAVGESGPGVVLMTFQETNVKVPAAVFYASVRHRTRILHLTESQVKTVAANMRNAEEHGVDYRVVQENVTGQWGGRLVAAPSSPCMYNEISGSNCSVDVAAVVYAVIKCQRRRVGQLGSRRQADECITDLTVRGDPYLHKPLVFDCCPMCHAGPAEVWLVDGQHGTCGGRHCKRPWLAMLTCCNIMQCRECLAHHVLMEETRALQAAMKEVMAIRGVESDGVGTTARCGVSTGGASSDLVNLVSSEEGTSDEEPSFPALTHDEVNGVTDDSDAFLSESDEFLPSGSDAYSPVDHDHASFLEKSPYRPLEPDDQLAARLFGAALFTNRGHSIAGRIQSRLQDPVTMCGRANQAVKDRGSSGEGWARFRVFRPDQRFNDELAKFRDRVAGSLVASTGSGEFLYTSDAVGFVGGAAAGSQVLSSGEPMWAEDRTDVLMLAVNLVDVWPDFDTEVAELYQLFQPIVPVLNRSKAGEEDRCPMHVIGLRQRSAGSCCLPTLLKLNGGGADADFDNWQEKAARFYAKVQCLEELVAPASARARVRIRDRTEQGMCCAIPGLEEFLYALSASLTAEYYPGLHLDTADAEAASGVGTVECIVFSSHPEAVFVAARTAREGGSDSQGVKVIELRSPTLILLDSTRVHHAACKNLAAAQYALEAMRSNTGVEAGVPEASAADDRTRRQCSSASVRSIEDAVLRFEVPSATEVSEFCWRSEEHQVPPRVTLIQLPADGDCLCHCLLYWLRHAAAMNRLDERQRVLNSSATSLTVASLRELFDTLHQRPGGLYDRLNEGVGTSRRGGHWGTGAAYMTHSREGYGKYVTTAGKYLSADHEVGAVADAWGFGCMVWPGWAMHHTDRSGAVQYFIALQFYRNHYNLIALDGSPVLRREEVMDKQFDFCRVDASFRSIADEVAAKQLEHVQQAERDQKSRDEHLARRIVREAQKEQEEQERLRKRQIEGDAELARRLSKRARTEPQRFGQGPPETAKVTRQRKKNQAGPGGPGRGRERGRGRGKGGSDGRD
eukprot:SAG11_NODE_1162_length_5642_cov_12.906188_1_plen_1572_part_00